MNVNDVMKYGHAHFLRTLEDLPQSEWETGGVCGVWSVKDIIGHIGANEVFLDEMLAGFVGEAMSTPFLDQLATLGPADFFGKFNDEQADLRKSHTAQQVLDEYNAAYERVAAKGLKIDHDTWRKNGTLAWYGDGYSLADYVVYGIYGHKREHLAEINAFKDRLKAERGG